MRKRRIRRRRKIGTRKEVEKIPLLYSPASTFTAHLPQTPDPPQLSNFPLREYTSILFFWSSGFQLRATVNFFEEIVHQRGGKYVLVSEN